MREIQKVCFASITYANLVQVEVYNKVKVNLVTLDANNGNHSKLGIFHRGHKYNMGSISHPSVLIYVCVTNLLRNIEYIFLQI